jgi:hypothetical protein
MTATILSNREQDDPRPGSDAERGNQDVLQQIATTDSLIRPVAAVS